ncbi:MAG: RNB domain-containing ribonuclease [Chloroflexota bacterium]
MHENHQNHRAILSKIAHRVMLERGLLPDFPAAVFADMEQVSHSSEAEAKTIRDQRMLLWASIDNDDSRDLDQLTVAEAMPAGKVKILVAIADVDRFVKKGSALDDHARINTTSVYTAAEIFPMLPEKISTDLTSLNLNQDRLAIVVEMVIAADGSIQEECIYSALVRNHAKLAYNMVSAWLEKKGDLPEEIAGVPGLADNLRLQEITAQSLKNFRHLNGALSLETIESKSVFDGDQLSSLEIEEKNRAKEIIEDFMIAANGVTIRYLSSKNSPTIRRVVRTPKRWDRIVTIAAGYKYILPEYPDSKALESFLVKQKAADPLRFPDLSLSIIKLLGSGEYVAEAPAPGAAGKKESVAQGHFGLAVKDYAHSTAPNRRYPDLLTQRLIKAALDGKPAPYTRNELDMLAAHCTVAEDAATKVERQVEKSADALLLESRIGEQFEAIITGASEKGTWVWLLKLPVAGKLVQGFEGLDVGEHVRVQLVEINVERGFIDFKKVSSSNLKKRSIT